MTQLKDLAAHLGLSITTVSRALDGYPDVSEATRARVTAAAERLGYAPHRAARRLRRGRADTIAALLPSGPGVGLAALVEALRGCGAALLQAGLDLVLLPVRDEADEMRRLARLVERRDADAVLIARTRRADARVDWLLERRVPFLCFGRSGRAAEHAHLDGDGFGGFRDAVLRLAALGHRQVAHVAAPGEFNFAALRRAGAERGALEAGIELAAAEAAPDETGGHAAARFLLAAAPRATAFLCATDGMAVGAARALGEAGRAPGRDVALWGHDNIPLGAFLDPPLASMEIADPDLGEHLARLLRACLDGGDPAELGTVLPLRHLERASLCAPPTTRQENAR